MNADDIFEKVINRSDSPGRGKKQCPECSMYVGVRAYKCECGYAFIKKLTKQEERIKQSQITPEEKMYAVAIGASRGRFIYTARGSSSIKLTKITANTINDYCDNVVFDGLQRGAIFTVRAIKNWLAHDLGYSTEEYRKAAEFVDQWRDAKMEGY